MEAVKLKLQYLFRGETCWDFIIIIIFIIPEAADYIWKVKHFMKGHCQVQVHLAMSSVKASGDPNVRLNYCWLFLTVQHCWLTVVSKAAAFPKFFFFKEVFIVSARVYTTLT